jgi:glucokinase
MSGPLLAGVDVGGSKVAVLLATPDLRPVARSVAETGVGDPGTAVDQVAAAIEGALALAGATTTDLAAIGIGVPGRVDPVAGHVTLAVNLGWHDLALGPLMTERFGRPVLIENDVRAAAAGLHARQVLPDDGDLAFLGIGTGISAGIVLGGRLHRGTRGLAGEIGHVVLDPDGPRCACGLRGCFEAIASGRAVAALAIEAIAAGTPSTLSGHAHITAVEVYREAAAGDPLAVALADAAGRAVARAVHELVMTYDVRRVVLGGGVTGAGSVFLAPVVAALDRLRVGSELAREALPPDVVVLLPPDADAGGWGAVVLARTAADSVAGVLPGGDRRREVAAG